MDTAGRDAVARGLAALAVATAEGGGTEEQARLQFIRVLRAHGTTDPTLLADAAATITDPAEASAAGEVAGEEAGAGDAGLDAAEAERIRASLGIPSTEAQLAALLRGREWLQRFAAELAA
jgi:large exoprotein involved in heme utilization and adhesion